MFYYRIVRYKNRLMHVNSFVSCVVSSSPLLPTVALPQDRRLGGGSTDLEVHRLRNETKNEEENTNGVGWFWLPSSEWNHGI